MNSMRKLLALVMLAALLCALVAPVTHAESPAILVVLFVLCACLTTVSRRPVFERCSVPFAPFCPLLASRAPPLR